MNWKCGQNRNKVLVNCERRPGSASVDQFDRLRDRSNTHVLFSESSLAQCGVEQFVTTISPRQKAEVLCTRTEFLIDSAWTVPLWSRKVTVRCSLRSSLLTTSETVLQQKKLWRLRFLWGTKRVWQVQSGWESWHSVSILGSEVKHQLIFEFLRKYSFWAR